jgi:hypothetical protein
MKVTSYSGLVCKNASKPMVMAGRVQPRLLRCSPLGAPAYESKSLELKQSVAFEQAAMQALSEHGSPSR